MRRQTRLMIGVFVLAWGGLALADDPVPASRTAGFLRAHWDYPAGASVGLGVIANRGDCTSTCLYQGLTVQGAGGIEGGELAIGFGRLVAENGRRNWMLQRTYVGYGVRAAALRTWGVGSGTRGETFLGVEGGYTMAQFGMRLGVFRGLEPAGARRSWRVFGGAGWGF